MTPIIQNELEILLSGSRGIYETLLGSCAASSGDLELAESAIATALHSLRSLLISSGLRVCIDTADRDYYCPECGDSLTGWGSRDRAIVTSSGEGRYPSKRYRCRKCNTDHYPWQLEQGLDEGNQFTLSARKMIAEEAAEGAYDKASHRLGRMGIPVSSSEVDQIACEVALWRKQEQEAVRVHNCRTGQVLSLPLHDWDLWPSDPVATDVVVFSVDGGFVRSDQLGSKGLEWFEVRSGIISLHREEEDARRFRLAGVMAADRLFEMMRSQWWQCPPAWRPPAAQQAHRMVFVADGAEWIWRRAGWYFPRCIQILDIYHAAEHVGAAARAAWGADDKQARRWIDTATQRLLEPDGPKGIITTLIDILRTGEAVDPDELRTQIGYLCRHRHRMHYHRWRSEGLPIGSGEMESTIKQVSTLRMCQSGMMWTKHNADLMLHLRAAYLSDSLDLTVKRERRIRTHRALKFRRQANFYKMAA